MGNESAQALNVMVRRLGRAIREVWPDAEPIGRAVGIGEVNALMLWDGTDNEVFKASVMRRMCTITWARPGEDPLTVAQFRARPEWSFVTVADIPERIERDLHRLGHVFCAAT